MICFGASLKTKTDVSIVFCNALRVRRRKRKEAVLVYQIAFSPKKLGKMEVTQVSEASSSLILTSGATSRVNALVSLKALKSLAMFLSGLFMLLLIPFRRQKNRCIALAEKPKDDSKQEIIHRKQQPILRVAAPLPSLISRRSNNQVSGDQDSLARRSLAIKSVVQRDGDSIREFSLFINSRGETLFTQSWTPASVKIKGLVVLLHGLNEHSGRYNQFAKQLNANGYKVYGIDWIGHGGSDGLHGYVHSLDYAVSDTKAFLEKTMTENPGFPCFFFGHSTGGSIILKLVLDPKIEGLVDGIVLTSPAIRVQPSHPIFGVLAPIFSFLLPTYQFGAANKKGLPVSRDPEALVAKYSDPLVYTGSIRVRTGSEILRITTYLQQNLRKIRVPFLLLHGTYDTVTDPDATQQLYDEASSTDKSIKLYEGLLHDLLFEPEREEITKDIIDWFNSKMK